jgi:hypothetical protein
MAFDDGASPVAESKSQSAVSPFSEYQPPEVPEELL